MYEFTWSTTVGVYGARTDSCTPVDHLVREGQLLGWGIPGTGVLVETLLERGADGDVAEAEAAIERPAAAPTDDGLVARDI